MGWVSKLVGWVGLGHTKWTHGQLCFGSERKMLGNEVTNA